MLNINIKNSQRHGFHIVDPSPWPLFISISVLFLTFGGVMYMHGYKWGKLLFALGLFLVVIVMALWWRDIIRESTYEGQHTSVVQKGLRIGIAIFILTEAIFFAAFFWSYFHFSINPSIFIGGVWPPARFPIINVWGVPLLNTIILVSSGATLTYAHYSILYGSKSDAFKGLLATILLAFIFLSFQLHEYQDAPFSIYNSVYGSCFFLLTGFHGLHVIVGTLFLCVCLFRLYFDHYSRERHLGFEAASWYWHFVDVIWILLFVIVYCWGS
jgi:cytochrome c oxidase subunit 3